MRQIRFSSSIDRKPEGHREQGMCLESQPHNGRVWIHICASKPVLLTTRQRTPSPFLPKCTVSPVWSEQAGACASSDAAAGEGRLPGGNVGELPEAEARLPLHRRPTVCQAEEGLCWVSAEERVRGHWAGADPGPGGAFHSLGQSVFLSFIKTHSWAWWRIPVIPTLGRLRQENHRKLKASLSHIVSSRTAWNAQQDAYLQKQSFIYYCIVAFILK